MNVAVQMKSRRGEAAASDRHTTRRHTTRHLFNCDAAPTDLVVEDLWSRPGVGISGQFFLRRL